jgi:hypothetical protein
MELWVNEIWLFATAVIFTAVGWYWGIKSNVIQISEAVIDSLIEQEFLKVRGTGKDMEILKHTEWCDKSNQ